MVHFLLVEFTYTGSGKSRLWEVYSNTGGGTVCDGWDEVGVEGVCMVLDMCDLTEFFSPPVR